MSKEFLVTGIGEKDGLRREFESQLDSLLEDAPADSFATSDIIRLNKGYFGTLQICSATGQFMAKASGSELFGITQDLLHQMKEKLGHWRKYRYFY